MDVSVSFNKSSTAKIHLHPGKNLFTGQKYLEEYFGELNSLEEDLVNVAAGIYGADLAVKRKEREGFIRDISISFEVANIHAFERIKEDLEYALHLTSKDNWDITFKPRNENPFNNLEWQDEEGAVLLFSGGLDSFSAAACLLQEIEEINLVSHITHGNRVVENSQKKCREVLEDFFEDKNINHFQIKAYGRNSSTFSFPKDRENTQRTRSLLFLSLAAIISRRKNLSRVLYIAENGQFAIHLPLNNSRIGPFSTHTADPSYVDQLESVFQTLLSNKNFKIDNPFLYKTKGEVIEEIPKELREKAKITNTCWMIQRLKEHCGVCIPCISRRISLEWNGKYFDEYKTDLFDLDLGKVDEKDTGKRNMIDYLEFISNFDGSKTNEELTFDFPELFDPMIDQSEAIKMYERLYDQSMDVLSNYKNLDSILNG